MDQITVFVKNQLKYSKTKVLLASGSVLVVIALVLGVSDNPPGIAVLGTGLGLMFYAFVHHWQDAAHFGTLFAVSIISLPVLVLLHNIFDGLNQNIGPIPVLSQLLEGLAVISFLVAILLSPVTAIIGLFGGLYFLLKSKLP